MKKIDGFEMENGHGHYRPVGYVAFNEVVALVRAAVASARRNRVRDLLVDTTALTGFRSPGTFQRFLAAVAWSDEAKEGACVAMVAREEMIHPRNFG